MRAITILVLFICLGARGQVIGGNAVIGGNILVGQGAASTLPELLDTFHDSDGVNLTNHLTDATGAQFVSQTWLKIATEFIIKGNAVTNDAAPGGTSGAYINHVMSGADVTLTMAITNNGPAASSHEWAIAARYDGVVTAGSGTAYVAYWQPASDNQAFVGKSISGTWTLLAGGTTVIGLTNFTLKIAGTSITVLTNNVLCTPLSVSDSSISAAGRVAIGGWFRGVRDSEAMIGTQLTATSP